MCLTALDSFIETLLYKYSLIFLYWIPTVFNV